MALAVSAHPKSPTPFDRNAHLEHYASGAKDLRGWFLAYGVGGPFLFISNKEVFARVANSPSALCIVTLFLIGVGLQILITLINKWNNWWLYRHWVDKRELAHQSLSVRLSNWLSDQILIDISVDLLSFGLMACATIMTIAVFI